MEYVNLGRTGKVSRLCLGCMSFGVPDRGTHPWTLDEEQSRPLIRPRRRGRHQLLRHRQHLLRRHQRGDHRPRAARLRAPRRGRRSRPRCSARCGQGPNGRRAVAQGDLPGDRRQPAAARHRLRRSLPDPPLGLRDADRGDARGAARRREGGQGPLHRRVVDVRVAVREGARTSPTRHGWTRFVSMQNHVQPALPRGGARDAAALPRPGRRRDPLEPARARPADARLGRDDRRARRPTSSARSSIPPRSSAIAPIVERVGDGRGSARRAARAGRAGLAAARSPASPRRSSARRRVGTSTDAVAALAVSLTPEEIAELEAPYVPHPVSGI